MGLVKWVKERTTQRAGFNFWEITRGHRKDDKNYWAYLTQAPGTDVQIAVLQRRRPCEWYLGTWEGKKHGDCKTDEEAAAHYRHLDAIATRKHRISGRYLDAAINKIVDETYRARGLGPV